MNFQLLWGAGQEVCSSGESILDVSAKKIVTKIRLRGNKRKQIGIVH